MAVVPFTGLETAKGELSRGQKTCLILDKLNLKSVRVKQVGMSGSPGGVWSGRSRLGPVDWFQAGASGLAPRLARGITRSVFTGLFLCSRLELLGGKNGAWLIFPFGHQHRAGYTVAGGKNALNEEMNEWANGGRGCNVYAL